MGWMFRKSKSIGPLRLTVTQRGISTSLGLGPFRVGNTASRGAYWSVGVPGTGWRYRDNLGRWDDGQSARTTTNDDPYAIYRKYQALTPMALLDAWAIHRMSGAVTTAMLLNTVTMLSAGVALVVGCWLPFAWWTAGLLAIVLLATFIWHYHALGRIGRHGRLANAHYERQLANMPPPLPEAYLAWYGTTFAQPEFEPTPLARNDSQGEALGRDVACAIGVVIYLGSWCGLLLLVGGQLVSGAATGAGAMVLLTLGGLLCAGLATGTLIAGESGM